MDNIPFKRKLGNVFHVEGHGNINVPYGISLDRYKGCLTIDRFRFPDVKGHRRFYYWKHYTKPIQCLNAIIDVINKLSKINQVDIHKHKRKTARVIYGVELLDGVTVQDQRDTHNRLRFKVSKGSHEKAVFFNVSSKFVKDEGYIANMAMKANECRKLFLDKCK